MIRTLSAFTLAGVRHQPGMVPLVLALALTAVAWVIARAVSVRLHPWRPCRRCGESGKHRGAVFTRSFRPCDRCGGTGREPRKHTRLP